MNGRQAIKSYVVDLAWLTSILFLAAVMLGWLLSWWLPNYSLNRLGGFAVIFWLSECLALFLARFPAGTEFVMLRLGGAAFCRTIVPLLLSLTFAWYSRGPLGREDAGPLLVFYGIGAVLGTVLSVRHLQTESPGGG